MLGAQFVLRLSVGDSGDLIFSFRAVFYGIAGGFNLQCSSLFVLSFYGILGDVIYGAVRSSTFFSWNAGGFDLRPSCYLFMGFWGLSFTAFVLSFYGI